MIYLKKIGQALLMTRKTIIVMGSGPGVTKSQNVPRKSSELFVAINNAWRVRNDWDFLIHPEDFPENRRPKLLREGQRIVGAKDYVPVQNEFGGFVYAGGTMAFTAGYWALGALKPRVIAMIGCDMVYPDKGPTHFYGHGKADPLRDDITLRSLEAKSVRFWALASRAGCAVVNLSTAQRTRLTFPTACHSELEKLRPTQFKENRVDKALQAEAAANYFVPSGRYWEEKSNFDPKVVDAIDRLWLDAVEHRKS